MDSSQLYTGSKLSINILKFFLSMSVAVSICLVRDIFSYHGEVEGIKQFLHFMINLVWLLAASLA